jgi:hypothetical protein
MYGRASGISFSGVSEHVHLHGLDRLFLSANEQAHLLGDFPAENLFAATRADLRGNILHKDRLPVHFKDFTHEFAAGFRRTTDMTFEHGYLRFLNSIHSSGSGSYKVIILTIGVSAKDLYVKRAILVCKAKYQTTWGILVIRVIFYQLSIFRHLSDFNCPFQRMVGKLEFSQ